jgi:alpha-tubulin suppressor-like RCC1 family protein
MGSNPTGFKITDTAAGWSGADFEDVFVRKDCFLEGGLWAWGGPFGPGGLGDNTTISKSSPVQTISGGTNWRSVSAGAATNAAIKTDGTLWLWACGTGGQLGNNSAINQSSPVQTISGGTNWRSVSPNGIATAAIKTDGTLWLWGGAANGALGTNSVVNQSSPVQTISGGTNWRSVSVSKEVGLTGCGHITAIKTDGTLWLWGRGGTGQLGTNSVVNQSSPVQTISGGTNWKSVAAVANTTAAIKTDGTLWLWGGGGYGKLGTNTTISQSSPVQTISGGTNWKSISTGAEHTAAIKTDGTLWLWGYGIGAQLGTNSRISQSSPVQTVSGGTNWRSVSLSGVSAAIKTDGTLWLWGGNGFGQLGTNTAIGQSSPVQTVSGGTNWRSVSASGGRVMAIREDCW